MRAPASDGVDPAHTAAVHGVQRLCAAAVVAYCSYAICRTPLLPLYARDLGAGPELVGLVVGASTLAGVVVKLPAGALSDIVGRRPMLLAGAAVFAVLPFAYLAVSTLAGLVVLRYLHGHATAIFGPVASASVSDLAPAGRRGAWLSGYAAAQGAGQALGPFLAGVLIAGGSFAPAFLTAGVIGLAAPLVVGGWRPPPRAVVAGPRWPALRDGIRDVVRDRRLLVASVANAGQFVLSGALNAFLPLYALEVVGLTATQTGGLFAIQTVATLLMRPVGGGLSDRLGRRALIVAGLVVCAATVAVIPLATSGAALAACVTVYAAGVAATAMAATAFVTDVTSRARYGAAHGVFGTIYDIGDALGPLAAGLVVAAAGYPAMFRAGAALALGIAALFAVLSGHAAPARTPA
ncbi:MAG: MFS transporter [Vicinamibacterales bacterium]